MNKVIIIVICIFAAYLGVMLFGLQPKYGIGKCGQLGDSFGAVSSFFSLATIVFLIHQSKKESERHKAEMEEQKKQHKEDLEEQRKIAEGADRPFLMPGDRMLLTRLPNKNYRFSDNIHDSDDWEEKLEHAKFVIEVDAHYYHGFALNCSILVEVTSLSDNRTVFRGFSPIGLFSNYAETRKRFGFLWTDFDKSSVGDEMAVCKISIYYTSTIGGCFVSTRESEPMAFFEGPSQSGIISNRCHYEFAFTTNRNIEAKQLTRKEYESLMMKYDAIRCDCCRILFNKPQRKQYQG